MKNIDLSSIISQHIQNNDWIEIERYFNNSALIKHLGISVNLEDPEQPKCEITDIQAFHLGGVGQGFINGAIISAIFDLVIGLTSLKYFSLGNFATSNVNIQFVKPVDNNRIYATSKRNTKIGNRVFSESTLFNFRDEPCAYATGEIRVGIKSGSP